MSHNETVEKTEYIEATYLGKSGISKPVHIYAAIRPACHPAGEAVRRAAVPTAWPR